MKTYEKQSAALQKWLAESPEYDFVMDMTVAALLSTVEVTGLSLQTLLHHADMEREARHKETMDRLKAETKQAKAFYAKGEA